jgi:hypothetical protein
MVRASDWLLMSRSGFGEYNYRSHYETGVWSPWEPLPYQDSGIRSLAEAGGAVFGLFGTAIQRSDDQGMTWTR